MKKYTSVKYILSVTFLGLIGFIPLNASAATVYLESSKTSISVGDTIIVSAKINAEGVTINTVEGDIALKTGGDKLAVQEFSLANSAFGLWPLTPSLSKDALVVSFVAGVPGGFNIEGATVFKIILEAKKEGTVKIAPQNIVAFANDGKGTKLPVQLKDLTITIGPRKAGTTPNNDWNSVVASDVLPPEDFIVVLGQDKTMFDGNKFAFFSSLDNQSGISYYEVSENGAPAVRSGSTYVLQNQEGDVKLDVTAFDKAGNKKIAKYSSVVPFSLSSYFAGVSWSTVIIIVLVFVIAFMLIGKLKKGKNNNAPLPQ